MCDPIPNETMPQLIKRLAKEWEAIKAMRDTMESDKHAIPERQSDS